MCSVGKIVSALLMSLSFIILAALLVLLCVNPNHYKANIEKLAQQQGIDLVLNGDVNYSLSLHPVITVTDMDVVVPMGKDRQRLHIGALQATVDVAAALFGNVSLHNLIVTNISHPQLTANGGKPLPFMLQATDIQGDRESDTLRVNNLAVHVANITVTAHIAVHSLSTLPVVTADPLAIAFADNRLHGKWQWASSNASSSLNLKSDRLTINHLAFSKVAMAAVIDSQQITLTNLQAKAYGGRISANGILSGLDTNVPRLTLHTRIRNMPLAPVLTDIRQQPSVVETGILQLDLSLATMPISWSVAMNHLTGSAIVELQNVVMQGVSPEQRVCESAVALTNQSAAISSTIGKTIIQKIRGKSDIKMGIASITALTAKLDALHATAEGLINLSNNTLDIRADLRRMNNKRAASFCTASLPALANVVWPLHCEGSYAVADGKDLCRIDKDNISKWVLHP